MSQANAFPTKAFFTDMLTRDIEISDAILDLIDNCIDGIIRLSTNEEVEYKNRIIALNVDEKSFRISDNCGGIPRSTAENYAFRFGRPHDYPSDEKGKKTVGVYGIGMKRAIFKIGDSAKIDTKNKDDCYSIEVTPDWLLDDQNWYLPILDDCMIEGADGTEISITELNSAISNKFADSSFIEELKTQISVTYAIMIDKGLIIKLNDNAINSKQISILFANKGKGLDPYLYVGEFDGVKVELAVGFYAPPPTQEEQDGEVDEPRLSERAGWTIICNDRVVLYNDKSRMTGWGEAKVPNFHTQFINISGVVMFSSKDTSKLPMTTTKRGVDASSELYLKIKDYMREGLKLFTSFTNNWKREEDKGASQIRGSVSLGVNDYFKSLNAESGTWREVRGSALENKKEPQMPRPTNINNSVWIRFQKPESEIRTLSSYLFDDEFASPNEVGLEVFRRLYEESVR